MSTPEKFCVCTLCKGEGTVVDPNIDAHGLSREDFDEDPDFAEEYMNGAYDIQCPRCKGQRVLLTEELEAIYQREAERADERRLRALEDGDFEGYCVAGDSRW